ncbi:hypothetical protein AMTRI_Chr06g198810 [Amborella trichopoda]
MALELGRPIISKLLKNFQTIHVFILKRPAINDYASLHLYTSTNWRRYLARMFRIEAMWKGEEISVDVFLKGSRHLKAVFLSI